MEWNQLHSFLVAAQEENFSRAAAVLHTSQPSLSQTIKRLEEELGYSLFDREGKHIYLNESGKVWMQTVLQMEELFESTRLRLEEQHDRQHPEVSIYIGCASTLLPRMLKYLRTRNPGIQYQIHQWNEIGAAREKDIQISAVTDNIDNSIVLLKEQIQLAIPAGHRLLEKEEITLKDIVDEDFISLNSNWALSRDIRQEMERIRFVPKVTMWVDNPNLMRELLKAGMGIAFVPSVTWHAFAGEEVSIRPVKECTMMRYVYLRTPEKVYITREQKECIKGIREFFGQMASEYSSVTLSSKQSGIPDLGEAK